MKKYNQFINETLKPTAEFDSDELFIKSVLNRFMKYGEYRHDYEGMKRALKLGADINVIMPEWIYGLRSYSALHIGAKEGNSKFVIFLVDNGADLNVVNRYGQTPLMLSIERGYLNITRYLIRKGANYRFIDKNGENIWMYAAKKGRLDDMMYILDRKGIDINHINNNGENILDVLYKTPNTRKSFAILSERYLKEHPYEAYKYVKMLSDELKNKYKEFIVLGRDFDVFD